MISIPGAAGPGFACLPLGELKEAGGRTRIRAEEMRRISAHHRAASLYLGPVCRCGELEAFAAA
ncbi:MAG: hypothetical protein QW835_05055 [Candidatus Hadarchaeum sp.]